MNGKRKPSELLSNVNLCNTCRKGHHRTATNFSGLNPWSGAGPHESFRVFSLLDFPRGQLPQ